MIKVLVVVVVIVVVITLNNNAASTDAFLLLPRTMMHQKSGILQQRHQQPPHFGYNYGLLCPTTSSISSYTTTTTTALSGATGGWGIGNSRELTPEEFLKSGDRRAPFDPYPIQGGTSGNDFRQKVQNDKKDMEREQLQELLGVAKLAGIAVKNPKERLNKYEDDLLLDEEEDDLDVSVPTTTTPWDEEESFNNNINDIDADSITRMDEDTGSLGNW